MEILIEAHFNIFFLNSKFRPSSVECCHREEEEYTQRGRDETDGGVGGEGSEQTDFDQQFSGGSSIQHIRIPMVDRKPVKFRYNLHYVCALYSTSYVKYIFLSPLSLFHEPLVSIL